MTDDQDRHELVTQLADVLENMKPLVEAATGLKAHMEEQGWSPTAAEACSMTWLQGMISRAFR